MSTLPSQPAPRTDELLLVGDVGRAGSPNLLRELRGALPGWTLCSETSFFAGIAAACENAPSAIVAFADSAVRDLPAAVRGLREAAGPHTPIVILTPPEREPAARELLEHGATDYIVAPLERSALRIALGLAQEEVPKARTSPPAEAPNIDAIAAMESAIGALTARPTELLAELAEMVRAGMNATGATLVLDGAAASSGTCQGNPVLSSVITKDDNPGDLRTIGQVSVWAGATAPYTSADALRLDALARIAAKLANAAKVTRTWHSLALVDECTGVWNRRYLHQQLDEMLPRAAKEQFPVTLLLFDIDDFKSYNDRFGHQAGDEIIRVVAALFADALRENDIVTRFGGDEFAVVFFDPEGPREPGSKQPQSPLSVLDRVTGDLQAYNFPFVPAGERVTVTISGGLATYPWQAGTKTELIQKADEALLAAKRAGKNRVFDIGSSQA